MSVKKALFGGSFDPIHSGHMALVRGFLEQLQLDGAVLMPTFVPPHKQRSRMAAAEHRLCMCELAAADDPRIAVSSLELERGGASFTVETLEALHAAELDTEWYLLTGADMFLSLDTWWRFEDIARMAVLCAAPRGDTTYEQLMTAAARLEAQGARCRVLPLPLYDVSSTEIRRRLLAGEPTDGLLPAAVADYIRRERLYTEERGMEHMTSDEQIIEIIRKRLKPKRFVHSLAVAEEAVRLAKRYGADPAKARTAGLLHDIMKNTEPETQLQILAEFGILLDTVEQHTTKLLHARSGAAFAERVLGVTDPDILAAVRYHTTARAGMSLLEKVLYLADFTSADRDYDDVDEMRRLVDIGLEEAMLYALRYTVVDLAGKNTDKSKAIHPDTLAAYNECVLRRSGEA